MRTTTQEALWALRAQSGDREALELLLGSIQPSLHRYVLGLVGTSPADDVLQEAFIVIARKIASLQHPELFRPWAFRIATRVASRYLRKQRRWLEQTADESVLEQLVARDPPLPDELIENLLAMDAITPASRAVLLLHFKEEMSLAAIAAILEIPIGTVKSRLAYGLSALRKHLGHNTGGSDVRRK